jgi:conjugal transfer/type IV secretion protein DotA/TraY
MVKASGAHLDPETIFGQAILPQAAGVPFTTTLGSNGMPAVGSGWITNNNTYTTGVTSLLSGGAPYYETTTLNKALSNSDVYYNGDQNTPAPPNQGITTNNASTGNSFMDAIVQGIASAIRNPILNYLQDLAGGNGTDPLISLGRFGTALMLAGEISVFAALITSIAISLAASSVSCMSPFAWGVNLLLVQLMPLIYGIAVMLWTGGATLGVYIPMIPYLIFTTSAFGWMIAVVEAIVGAPIIALGLTHPSDGELGKATEGLIIVANIFLRPTLMIFGFVIGASLMRAGLALINFGFIPALNEGTSATLFSIIAVLAMYIFLVMTLINKSFALIYMLPNKILRWMGGRSEEFDPSDMTNQAKSGFESGAGKAQGMQEAGLKAAGDKSKGATDQRNKSLENPGGQGGGQLPSPGGAGGAGGTPG